MLHLHRRNRTVTASDFQQALQALGLSGREHLMAHASLSAFGYVHGGAEILSELLKSHTATVVMPAFTYYTLVWPEAYRTPEWPPHPPGPMGSFHRFSRVSRDIGKVPQALVDDPEVLRSNHPALSFVAYGQRAEDILNAQTLREPYAPAGALYDLAGKVLLAGVDHTSNTTIHYGEYLAGQLELPRYVIQDGKLQSTYFPNCSAGFQRIERHLIHKKSVKVGAGVLALYDVQELIDVTVMLLSKNPEALLCHYSGCRCQYVRSLLKFHHISARTHQPKVL
ncbi:AAC(3) family N-acetyltransferase [Deinococcus cellulosilyticus]|uniref:Aminoglycoside N(3)-acetyltransferase n=1 Tax=Deinococcus cellulosilyticus (strain DSM 18568 / NBRC 106333 / KACC 11606 / 5516J-15) TaxID=1223518 RepID=A0A511MYE9_DEIC1|nr:AAC(3) family N-acetyltransferase [Deinococcus cellulosilyticus]GEM45381.1 AAC(3) family N-acetyltransferase [Deinococcus cellulosilyticus NBRC 106333 = KACC 11606]